MALESSWANKQQIDECCRLAIFGMQISEISKAVGITYDQVRYSLYKRGIRIKAYRTRRNRTSRYVLKDKGANKIAERDLITALKNARIRRVV